MKLRVIAIILFVTALAQGAFIFNSSRPRVVSKSNAASVAEPPAEIKSGVTEKAPTEMPAASKPRFDWSSIETTDFEQYIANLRAIQCPEQTIRDIIIADVNKLYAPREAAFLPPDAKPKAVLPWEAQTNSTRSTAAADLKADFERRRQLREIEREKAAVIQQLLGIDLPLSPLRGWRSRNYDRIESALAALPPEKRERVREIQEVYWQASDTLNDQTKERGPAFAAEYQRINDERRNLMAQVLTPEEMDDFEMRGSSLSQQLGGQLANFKPSEQEFRTIYSARRELDDPTVAGARADGGGETPEQRQVREEAARTQIKEALGEERYAQYERSLDPAWQQLSRLQNRLGVEPEKIEEAYKLVGELKSEFSAKVGSLQGGTPTEIAAAKNDYQARIQEGIAQLSSILGEKAGLIMQARSDAFVPNPGKLNVRTVGRVPEPGQEVFIKQP